ncbi:hypothetical protein HCG49_13900 [Arenibacter sp. 6A1]|uniref:DsbA family protein n=1 Tax=Arenibacter sp. 6A1 TaxID=2720391 RepID=UPI001447E644|nr:hypothetical protein [Arenibacter sp. 6A1]NKI27658.1 hypothetical protein [Arenibacter sp. 6A1]
MLTAFYGWFYEIPIIWGTLPILLSLSLLPVLIWKLTKPLIEAKKEANLYRRHLKKIKYNPTVLEGLLTKTRKITSKTEGLGISFKTKNAKYNVLKICNPYCDPCAKAHPILEELLNKGKINLQILFTARADNKDLMARPVRHFLAIDEMGDKKRTQLILDEWYRVENKNYKVFAHKYPKNGELEQQNKKIAAMRQWCDDENITHTPTIFINGYELPR